MQNFDLNIGFWEKRQFFRQKLQNIVENCDHNIDPCFDWFCSNWCYRLFEGLELRFLAFLAAKATRRQGDKIGRNFAFWAVILFGLFIWKAV
jgi:hypothetical protein